LTMMTSEARRRAVSSARSAVTIKGTGCCPPFDPTSWQARELVWNEKLFVVDRVHSLLHVPIDMARKVRLNRARIDAAAAAPSRGLMLLDEDSLWGADLYLEVDDALGKVQNRDLRRGVSQGGRLGYRDARASRC
jgi:hypothetical protein